MSYQTKVRANNLNRTAKLSFYTSRKRRGDVWTLAEQTGYSERMIYYVLRGDFSPNQNIADAMYSLASRRNKNVIA